MLTRFMHLYVIGTYRYDFGDGYLDQNNYLNNIGGPTLSIKSGRR